jgi:hypothetical protein
MFRFWPEKHSVIQAAYGYPCIPYNFIHHGAHSFYSGPMPVGEVSPSDWDKVRPRPAMLASHDND